MLSITTGKISDVGQANALRLPEGSIDVLDRGYVDFARLHRLVQRGCSFVVFAKGQLELLLQRSARDRYPGWGVLGSNHGADR